MVSITMGSLIFLVSTMLPFETNDLPQEEEEEIDPFAELEIGTKSYNQAGNDALAAFAEDDDPCLLYTSPSPRDVEESRMPSSA